MISDEMRIKARIALDDAVGIPPEPHSTAWDDHIEALWLLFAPTIRADAIEEVMCRQCVNCGRTFPASHPREQPPTDCKSPDACTIDMTLMEALSHWRKAAHNYLSERDAAMKQAAEMQRSRDQYREAWEAEKARFTKDSAAPAQT